jgi:hypothetical protein
MTEEEFKDFFVIQQRNENAEPICSVPLTRTQAYRTAREAQDVICTVVRFEMLFDNRIDHVKAAKQRLADAMAALANGYTFGALDEVNDATHALKVELCKAKLDH